MSSPCAGEGAELLPTTRPGVLRAASILEAGGLVAFPTETVYGLGADARTENAVAGVFAAKGRPASNPLIVHVADLAAAAREAEFSREAYALAEAFWPGPLTLVLPRRADSPLAVAAFAGLPTVALRAPAHAVAAELLAALRGPIVGPSANVSGRVSPTEASHVMADLGGRIHAVLDAGRCEVGIESTIVGFGDAGPALLRSGAVPEEALAEAMGRFLLRPAAGARPAAPGGFRSHYAPEAALRLDAERPEPGEAWLGFGVEPAEAALAPARRNLAPDGSTGKAARRLYACLRDLDAAVGGEGRIAVAPIPEAGVGAAINDRLRRAAAPRRK